MKLLLSFCLIISIQLVYGQKTTLKAEKVWETTDILTTSESVCYYDEDKVIFVACINGKPTDKDGNGFISQLSLSGEVISHHWATGLNAPKGMGILNESLFVTDIDRVVQFSLKDGSFVMEYPAEGAEFLNDITVDPLNNIYVSDMASNDIYKVGKGVLELWISSELLVKPNGLNFEDGNLLVGTKNGIFSINYEDKEISHLVKNTGGIDGLEIYGGGSYIISDWSGKVQIVHPSHEAVILFNTTDDNVNAADIHYIKNWNLLLVPTFFDNRVMAYEIIGE